MGADGVTCVGASSPLVPGGVFSVEEIGAAQEGQKRLPAGASLEQVTQRSIWSRPVSRIVRRTTQARQYHG